MKTVQHRPDEGQDLAGPPALLLGSDRRFYVPTQGTELGTRLAIAQPKETRLVNLRVLVQLAVAGAAEEPFAIGCDLHTYEMHPLRKQARVTDGDPDRFAMRPITDGEAHRIQEVLALYTAEMMSEVRLAPSPSPR